jgi:hypothetical protein
MTMTETETTTTSAAPTLLPAPTPREWQPYPTNLPVPTKLGTVFVAVTTANTMYVTAGNERGQLPITVFGVDYHLGLHLSRQPGGRWGLADQSSLSLSRTDWTNYAKAHGSNAARARAYTDVYMAVVAWAEANPTIFEAADAADRNNRALSIEKEIAELTTKLTEAWTALGRVTAERPYSASA